MVTRYLFYSHDGYGLGHVRRNSLIARAVLDTDPAAQVSLVTGVKVRPRWLRQSRPGCACTGCRPCCKSADGSYRHETLSFGDAVRERERIFATAGRATNGPTSWSSTGIPTGRPASSVPGLDLARRRGAALVLGLRDVLDEPSIVREEMRGLGWADVEDVYDDVLVYGARHFVDHEAEYGLSLPLHYCGWVVERPGPSRSDRNLLVVAAGGGGDGAAVFEMGARAARATAPTWSVSSPPARTPAPTRCAG